MAASQKKRARSRAQTSKTPKRRRVSKARASKALKDETLPFPAAILALPHVMELIDAFRMTPKEAARRAVTTGQSEWLGQLISKYGSSVTSADMLVDAAAKGDEEAVKKLMPAVSGWGRSRCEAVLPAVEAAGVNGRYGTLKFLLPELDMLYSNEKEKVCKVVGKILGEAAEHGCLEAVVAIVENAQKKHYAGVIGENSKALSGAVAGGHTGVIEFMQKLDIYTWRWDLPDAVAAAVRAKRTAIAQKLYGKFHQYEGMNFYACLSHHGHTDAVEYFFPKVSNNVGLLNEALLAAAKSDKHDVVEFLLATKRIPSDLSKQAFVVAARHAATSVVQHLLVNHQVSSETIDAGFISAAEGLHVSLMQSLYTEQQISSEAVLEAFKNSWDTWTKTQKYLAELLRDQTLIPREFRHKAFVDAALTGKTSALKYLVWHEIPLDVLKEAYATERKSTKVIVGEITCKQVFRPNYMARFH